MTTVEAQRVAASRKPGEVATYLKLAREQAHLDAAQISAFQSRITQLPSATPAASELTLAFEELRAQHATLHDAYTVLEEEHGRYMELFDSSPEAFVTTDARGVIRHGNATAASLLAVDRDRLRKKLLIAFVARGDTRSFRDHLTTSTQAVGRRTFSLDLRPRGGVPFAASLSVRTVRRRSDGLLELHWVIRPAHQDASDGERDLLVDVAREVRSALGAGSGRLASLAEDLEQLAQATGVATRSAIAPAVLVEKAMELGAARAGSTVAATVHLGPLEAAACLRVAVERTAWALSRLFALVGHARVRGWRKGPSYVLEVRAWSPCELRVQPLAYAAIQASLGAEGATLRVSAPAGDDEWPVCEISLPLGEAPSTPQESGLRLAGR